MNITQRGDVKSRYRKFLKCFEKMTTMYIGVAQWRWANKFPK